jgi:YYY domain-containing protein
MPREALALLAVVLLAAALRLHGLDWDQGQHLHPDERFLTMVATAIRAPDSVGGYFDTARSPLNPGNQGHSFFVYGTLPLFLVRFLASLLGMEDYDSIHRVGRGLAALFDLGTVLLTFALGRLLGGPRLAIAAAALMATGVAAIQQAHFFTVDSFGAFFATAALLATLHAARGAGLGAHLAFGLAFGAALACRINLGLLLAIHGLAIARALGAGVLSPGRALGAAGVASSVAAATFRVLQPYAFAGPGLLDVAPAADYLASLGTIRGLVSGSTDFPPSVQWIGRLPVIHAGKDLLLWGLGPAWGLAAVAGLVASLSPRSWRRGPMAGVVGRPEGEQRVLTALAAAWAVLLFGYHSLQFAATLRYFLPILPVLAVVAARPLSKSGGWRLALLVVLLVANGAWALAFSSIYRQPHTRVEASRWIYAHVPEGAAIASEHWDDGLPLHLPEHSPERYSRFDLELYAEESAYKRSRLLDQLDRADYLVLSSNRLYGAIPRAPWRYPLARRYYELLFSGELGFALERVFSAYPRLGPLEIRDDGAEEAFTVYDHPKVLIFRKAPGFSRTRVEALLEAVSLDRVRALPPRESSVLYRRFLPSDVAPPPEAAAASPEAPRVPTSSAALARWLLALELLSFAAFAVLLPPLRGTPDAGFALAKLLAWLAPGYLAWWASSLGLAANTTATVRTAAAALLAAGAWAAWRSRRILLFELRSRRRTLLATELAFLLGFACFAALRAFNPTIYWGEKQMDFAILNAIVRSRTMPPVDPWFAGETLNYAYFGHALVAFFARLSAVPPAFAFNLGIATVGGLLAASAFAAGRMLGRRVLAGGLAALAVVWLGNLAGPRRWLAAVGDVIAFDFNFDFFWATSRVIEGTVNEFPFWSLLFGDLHGHVLALPFDVALLWVGGLWLRGGGSSARPRRWLVLVLAGWLVGATAVTSAWNLPVALVVQAAFLLLDARIRGGGPRALLRAAGLGTGIAALAMLAFWPFWIHYQPPSTGAWGFEQGAAPLSAVVTIFGPLLLAVVPALLGGAGRRGPTALAVALVAVVLALVRSPAAGFFAALAALGLAVCMGRARPEDEGASNSRFPDAVPIGALLVGVAGLVGLVTEAVYVWDRMNTVFKYYLHMWLLLAVAAGVLLPAVLPRTGRGLRRIWVGVLVLGALGGVFTSVSAGFGLLRFPRAESKGPTLDGSSYLDTYAPAERSAFRWLARELRGVPVLLEAQGPSYQQFSRVSMNSGLPSVLGWEYHLFQQGRSREAIAARRDDIRQLFETTDLDVASRLLEKYRIDVIFVGELERETYGAAGLRKFETWSRMEPVFREGEVTIYASPGLVATEKSWIDPGPGVTTADAPPPPGRLREPRDLALAPDGRLLVADFGHRRIQIFGADREPQGSIGGEGSAPGAFRDPCGIAVAADGAFYVADTWNHRIQHFTSGGRFQAAWTAGFYGPRGVATSPDGSVYVTDTGNRRVVRFGPAGELLAQWDEAGDGVPLQAPVGIAVGPHLEVYVADPGLRRILVFSAEGEPLRSWPVAGWLPGNRLEPYLDVGPDGTVWVTDPTSDRVLLHGPDGRPLGEAVAEEALAVPLGIAVLGPDQAVVTSAARNRLVTVRRPGAR